MKVYSFGAAKTVTGSCHIVKYGNASVMIDCGLFQGKDVEDKNINLGFNPEEVNHIILTHSHLDHCGRIPLLIKKGFNGDIFCTLPTFQLARLILLDAAKIMLEDYKHNIKRHFRLGKSKQEKPELLYNEVDVFETLDHFKPVLSYNNPFTIDKKNNIIVELHDAGHILGSSFVKLIINNRSIIFSGDLGNKEKPVVNNFSYPDQADAVYIETTYGDRLHKSFEDSKVELLNIIKNTIKNGGNVLIPSFAMERTQDILYVLKQFYKNKELPKCKIFLDSPLAVSITNIFLHNLTFFRQDVHDIFRNEDPFDIPYLKEIRDIEESKAINNISEGAIIIAGSGMLTGGRMLHHLKYNLWRRGNSIIFIGYQARGTLGRRIVDGEKSVKVFGEPIEVGANVFTLGGFSSHADQNELIDWLSPLRNTAKVFLIHGEEDKMLIFKNKLETLNINAYIPSFGEEIEF